MRGRRGCAAGNLKAESTPPRNGPATDAARFGTRSTAPPHTASGAHMMVRTTARPTYARQARMRDGPGAHTPAPAAETHPYVPRGHRPRLPETRSHETTIPRRRHRHRHRDACLRVRLVRPFHPREGARRERRPPEGNLFPGQQHVLHAGIRQLEPPEHMEHHVRRLRRPLARRLRFRRRRRAGARVHRRRTGQMGLHRLLLHQLAGRLRHPRRRARHPEPGSTARSAERRKQHRGGHRPHQRHGAHGVRHAGDARLVRRVRVLGHRHKLQQPRHGGGP